MLGAGKVANFLTTHCKDGMLGLQYELGALFRTGRERGRAEIDG